MADIAPPLEGKLVRLRRYEPADYTPLNHLFNGPAVLEGIGAPWPQPVAGFREFVEKATAGGQPMFAIETVDDRTPIGGCGLMDIHAPTRSAKLGIWVAKPHWDRGYGTDATRTLCRFAFRYMNLHRIELDVFATNPRATRTYEKVGFQLEGTRRHGTFQEGRHADSHIMSLLDNELVED
jgi:RimJ/RimL family protein N-acetyltransferase